MRFESKQRNPSFLALVVTFRNLFLPLKNAKFDFESLLFPLAELKTKFEPYRPFQGFKYLVLCSKTALEN